MNNMAYTIIAVVVILVIIFGPFFTVWSLNTLFPVLAIPYTLETWAATTILFATIRGTFAKVNKD